MHQCNKLYCFPELCEDIFLSVIIPYTNRFYRHSLYIKVWGNIWWIYDGFWWISQTLSNPFYFCIMDFQVQQNIIQEKCRSGLDFSHEELIDLITFSISKSINRLMFLTITGCKSAANQTLCAGNTDVNKLHMNAHKKDHMGFTSLKQEKVHLFGHVTNLWQI